MFFSVPLDMTCSRETGILMSQMAIGSGRNTGIYGEALNCRRNWPWVRDLNYPNAWKVSNRKYWSTEYTDSQTSRMGKASLRKYSDSVDVR